MAKIKLNDKGIKLYPWLADVELTVYGYLEKFDAFRVYDYITQDWKVIPTFQCEGVEL